MTHSGHSKDAEDEQRAPTCTSQPNILYAWAHDAPKLELPKGVGFRVGGQTSNSYLVLQVHYMHESDKEDHSGVSVVSTLEPQPRTAATLLMVTGGEIQPKSEEQLEVACVVDEPVQMHPFAFRVHTHRHGTKVGGWVVRENAVNGQDEWIKLGERNPQLPQLFETVANQSIVVSQGDILAARCNIKNTEDRKIEVGSTSEDEMCNFYMMYWVEGEDVLQNHICYSPGSPSYKWAKKLDSTISPTELHSLMELN
uniref:peptidylglycine monooxygenase n=1 Tax=Ditylenchus dipsaci TaxID=166011 RepID=A0A915DGP2_9BILA